MMLKVDRMKVYRESEAWWGVWRVEGQAADRKLESLKRRINSGETKAGKYLNRRFLNTGWST